MNKTILLFIPFSFLLWQCGTKTNDSAKSKAQALLSQMTLEEKAGQMTQLTIEMISKGEGFNLEKPHALDTTKLQNVIVNLGIGSILNVGGHTYDVNHWKEIITSIEKYSQQSRLKIPVLYGIDAIHGANYTVGATLYPQQIGLAATFNPEMAYKMAQFVANDVRGSGIPWNFSPVLDVGRNPMWPRFWETFGEDPFLVSQMGVAIVNGYQNTNNGTVKPFAACLKHYVAYSNPQSGHDRTPAYIPERQLREIYLLPFAKAIAAGAKTIMINSGEWNGEPVHASKFLLQTVLRNELKFEGITVTDWEDIKNLTERHKVAETYKEAVALAINAGIDLAMVPLDLDFTKYLIENVNEGKIKKERIDEAVLRILTLKYELGLFDEPNAKPENFKEPEQIESKKLSYELACQSITLLKNEGNILPFSMNEKILVTGPNADYINALNGGWSHTWQGRDTSYNPKVLTVVNALKNVFANGNVSYLKGNTYTQNLPENVLLNAAQNVNTVVLCLGEDTYTEKPGDINDLELDESQQNLIKMYKKAGKKVVVILLEGRPRTFAKTEPLCDAILDAYLPGNEGALAIADIMVGKVNPSGKLPFTFPRFAGVHTTYDCKYTETLNNDFKPIGFDPLFHFGQGLSYSNFNYANMKIENRDVTVKDTVSITVQLNNTSAIAGSETVLVFASDVYASITPSVKRLRAFKRVPLDKYEGKEVQFKIAVTDLAFVGLDNKFIVEPGKFYFSIANLKDSINVK
jgi:beta-glucosidase